MSKELYPIPEPRISEFEQRAFGMFMHWGLYSEGIGAWAWTLNNIPRDEYIAKMHRFTTSAFDPEKIVLMAKNAGMKYIVLTTRHHDGFSLYDTKGLCEFDAPHSGAKRDLVKEFVESCNRHGIIPHFYHTTLDWYQKSFNEDFKGYLKYLRDSIEVLCTQYGKIGGFWFDGFWSKPDADWEEDELYGVIRKHQPEAIIVDNIGGARKGKIPHPEIDSTTFENELAKPINRRGLKKYFAGEMCDILSNSWSHGNEEFNYQTAKEVIYKLCDCRKVGANYLLNIAPDFDGGVALMQQALLELVGKWMHLFSEAIYNGRPYTIYEEGNNFALKRDDTIYFFIKDYPKGMNYSITAKDKQYFVCNFRNVTDDISHMEWLDNGETIVFAKFDEILSFRADALKFGQIYSARVAVAKIKHTTNEETVVPIQEEQNLGAI